MNKISKIFSFVALFCASLFSINANAQTLDDATINQLLSIIMEQLNSPEMQEEMKKEAELSRFNASLDGRTISLDLTIADKNVNLDSLDAEEQEKLKSEFTSSFLTGFEAGSEAEMVKSIFHSAGIKFKFFIRDVHGNTITTSYAF